MFAKRVLAGTLMVLLLTQVQAAELDLATHFPRYTKYDPMVPVYVVSGERTIHRFFDTSPISPSGRYLAVLRMPYEDRAPAPGDVAEVVVVDLKTGQSRTVAQSRGWESQVGANVQWGRSDSELYFNDVDPSTWRAFAVQLDPATGRRRQMQGTVFMVSSDGKTLASFNMVTAHRAQPGYGVMIPEDLIVPTRGPSDKDGIWLTDVDTGRTRLLISTKTLYEQCVPSFQIEQPQTCEFYLFQVKWNPQGTRLMASVQWAPAGTTKRQRVVVTVKADGTDPRTAVTAAQWARGHHMCWCPDGDHISMNLDLDNDRKLELAMVRYDGTDLHEIFRPGSGHPSFHPAGRYVIDDAYPYEPVAWKDGSVPIRLIDIQKQTCVNIARIYVSSVKGALRVDAHPAWDRTGRYVTFNGFDGDSRKVYIADLAGLLERPAQAPAPH